MNEGKINSSPVNPIRDLFEKILKGKLARVPAGSFKSSLPQVNRISFIPFRPTHENERPSIHVVVNYNKAKNESRNSMWSIGEDGTFSGRITPDMKISRDDLALEILGILEQIDLTFWHKTQVEIFPDKDIKAASESDGDNPPGKKPGGPDQPTDPKRLEFLEKQHQALFGFYNEKTGFNGYHGAIFPTFAVLENPQVGNAVYIVPLAKPVEIPKNEVGLVQKINKEETVERILKESWEPIARQARTRAIMREKFNAVRVIHTPETWATRLQEEINIQLTNSKLAPNKN